MFLQLSSDDRRLSEEEKNNSIVTSCCLLTDNEIDTFLKDQYLIFYIFLLLFKFVIYSLDIFLIFETL